MHDAQGVEVFQGREDLPEELAALHLRELGFVGEDLAQGTLRTELQHEEEIVVFVDDLG